MFREFSSRGFAHLHTAGPLMVRSQVLPRDQAPDTLSNPCGSFRQDLRVIFKCSQSDPLHQRGSTWSRDSSVCSSTAGILFICCLSEQLQK